MKINNDNVSKTPDSDVSSRLREKMLRVRNKQTVINNRASISDDAVGTHIIENAHIIDPPVTDEVTEVVIPDTDLGNTITLSNDDYKKLLTAAKASGYDPSNDVVDVADEVDEVDEVDVVDEVNEVNEVNDDDNDDEVDDNDDTDDDTDDGDEDDDNDDTDNKDDNDANDVDVDDEVDDEVDDVDDVDDDDDVDGTDNYVDKRKKWLIIGAGTLFVVVALGIGYIFTSQSRTHAPTKETLVSMQSSSKSKNNKESTKSTDVKPVDPQEAVKEKLETVAKATEQPYKINTAEIGGNYISGVITYYPDDSTKTYMDYSITAPDKPLATTADDKANKIEYKLKTSLPTINKTITVIDASKVTMATYKQNDSYNTILMYDGQPFGYVTTDKDDKDDNMVNNVTTYYIQKVQKNN